METILNEEELPIHPTTNSDKVPDQIESILNHERNWMPKWVDTSDFATAVFNRVFEAEWTEIEKQAHETCRAEIKQHLLWLRQSNDWTLSALSDEQIATICDSVTNPIADLIIWLRTTSPWVHVTDEYTKRMEMKIQEKKMIEHLMKISWDLWDYSINKLGSWKIYLAKERSFITLWILRIWVKSEGLANILVDWPDRLQLSPSSHEKFEEISKVATLIHEKTGYQIVITDSVIPKRAGK